MEAVLAHARGTGQELVLRERGSVENGCLTPTLKIKRARIESMLGLGEPLWA